MLRGVEAPPNFISTFIWNFVRFFIVLFTVKIASECVLDTLKSQKFLGEHDPLSIQQIN